MGTNPFRSETRPKAIGPQTVFEVPRQEKGPCRGCECTETDQGGRQEGERQERKGEAERQGEGEGAGE